MTRDGPLWAVLAAIALGAVFGAWCRWALAYFLNPRLERLPLGTLLANLSGAYLIGVALAVFIAQPTVSPFWRLMIVTGFLGSLTTFSTFSAEAVALIQGGHLLAAAWHSALHLGGSLAATFLGMATVRWLAS